MIATTSSAWQTDARQLRLRPASDDRARWDAALVQSPGGGHIYQSYAWGEFKRAHGWQPLRTWLLQGETVVGCGQVLVRSLGPLGSLAYLAKGPWIAWDDPAHVRVYFEGLEAMLRARGVLLLRIEPEVRESDERVQRQLADLGFFPGRWNQQFKTTMFVDLSPTEEVLLATMRPGTRRNIRLAARHGIVVAEDNSREARERFFAMYERTQQRDGFFLRPKAYLMGGWDALISAGQGHLFFASHDGQPLAGMFVCTLGSKYWYKDGASENEKRNLMPTYGLQWEVMRWARAHGFTRYDMVAIPDPDRLDDPTDSMHGLYRFKAGFGGTVTEFMRERVRWYRPRLGRLWYQAEPITYRLYKRLFKDVYYSSRLPQPAT